MAKFADVCAEKWLLNVEGNDFCFCFCFYICWWLFVFFLFSLSFLPLTPPPFFLFFFFPCPYDRILHYIPDGSKTHWGAQAGPKLMTIFLPQPPTYWEHGKESLCLALNFIVRIILVVVIVFWCYDCTQSLVHARRILYQSTIPSTLVFLKGICKCLMHNIECSAYCFSFWTLSKSLEVAALMTESHCPIPLNADSTWSLSMATESLPFPWWILSMSESFSPPNIYPIWTL